MLDGSHLTPKQARAKERRTPRNYFIGSKPLERHEVFIQLDVGYRKPIATNWRPDTTRNWWIMADYIFVEQDLRRRCADHEYVRDSVYKLVAYNPDKDCAISSAVKRVRDWLATGDPCTTPYPADLRYRGGQDR